jgi:PilX N-terminal
MKTVVFNRHHQSGATLVIALIILIVLMILGVGAVMTANSQFKMAGNLQFENQAKNAAENQLAIAENWLNTNGGKATTLVKGTAVTVGGTGKDSYTLVLIGNNKIPLGGSGSVGAGIPPAGTAQVNLFQVTGHGESARGASRDVVAIYEVLN